MQSHANSAQSDVIARKINELQIPDDIANLELEIHFPDKSSETQLAFYSKCMQIYAQLIQPENSEVAIQKLYNYLNKFTDTMQECQKKLSIAEQPLNDILVSAQHINNVDVKHEILVQIYHLSLCIKLFNEITRYTHTIAENLCLSEIKSVLETDNVSEISDVQKQCLRLIQDLFNRFLGFDLNAKGQYNEVLDRHLAGIFGIASSKDITLNIFKYMLFLISVKRNTEDLCTYIIDNVAIETINKLTTNINAKIEITIEPIITQIHLITKYLYNKKNKEKIEATLIQINGLIQISDYLTLPLKNKSLQICKSKLLITLLKLNEKNIKGLKYFEIFPLNIINPYNIFELQNLNIHFPKIISDALQFFNAPTSTRLTNRSRGKQITNLSRIIYTNEQIATKTKDYLQYICKYIMGSTIQFPTIEFDPTKSFESMIEKLFLAISQSYNNYLLNLYCIDETLYFITTLFPVKEKEIIPILTNNKLDLLYACIKASLIEKNNPLNFLTYCNKFIELMKLNTKKTKSQNARFKEIYFELALYLYEKEDSDAIVIINEALSSFPDNAALVRLRILFYASTIGAPIIECLNNLADESKNEFVDITYQKIKDDLERLAKLDPILCAKVQSEFMKTNIPQFYEKLKINKFQPKVADLLKEFNKILDLEELIPPTEPLLIVNSPFADLQKEFAQLKKLHGVMHAYFRSLTQQLFDCTTLNSLICLNCTMLNDLSKDISDKKDVSMNEILNAQDLIKAAQYDIASLIYKFNYLRKELITYKNKYKEFHIQQNVLIEKMEKASIATVLKVEKRKKISAAEINKHFDKSKIMISTNLENVNRLKEKLISSQQNEVVLSTEVIQSIEICRLANTQLEQLKQTEIEKQIALNNSILELEKFSDLEYQHSDTNRLLKGEGSAITLHHIKFLFDLSRNFAKINQKLENPDLRENELTLYLTGSLLYRLGIFHARKDANLAAKFCVNDIDAVFNYNDANKDYCINLLESVGFNVQDNRKYLKATKTFNGVTFDITGRYVNYKTHTFTACHEIKASVSDNPNSGDNVITLHDEYYFCIENADSNNKNAIENFFKFCRGEEFLVKRPNISLQSGFCRITSTTKTKLDSMFTIDYNNTPDDTRWICYNQIFDILENQFIYDLSHSGVNACMEMFEFIKHGISPAAEENAFAHIKTFYTAWFKVSDYYSAENIEAVAYTCAKEFIDKHLHFKKQYEEAFNKSSREEKRLAIIEEIHAVATLAISLLIPPAQGFTARPTNVIFQNEDTIQSPHVPLKYFSVHSTTSVTTFKANNEGLSPLFVASNRPAEQYNSTRSGNEKSKGTGKNSGRGNGRGRGQNTSTGRGQDSNRGRGINTQTISQPNSEHDPRLFSQTQTQVKKAPRPKARGRGK